MKLWSHGMEWDEKMLHEAVDHLIHSVEKHKIEEYYARYFEKDEE